MKKRILIIASTSGSLIRFRGDFIKNLIHNGFDIFTASPTSNNDNFNILCSFGAIPLEINLQRTGLNPIKDLKTIYELKSIILNNHIDLVFPYTVKPVIYGSIAANMCNIPVISLITGLGYTFSGVSLKVKLLQHFNQALYKLSIRKNKVIVFQNRDDYDLFIEKNIILTKQKVEFVSGSGVNLDLFRFKEKNNSENVSFLLVARLIKEKGISLYMNAAKVLKAKHPQTEFHLIGITETSPSAICKEELSELHEKGIIIFHGTQSNIEEHLHKTDVFVLPSYYREGLPRTALEACSCGNPIITTDSVGCREAVREGENGFLIEPKNLDDLVKAMEFFILKPQKIHEMGLNSRKYAEERFDVNIINQDLLEIISNVLKN